MKSFLSQFRPGQGTRLGSYAAPMDWVLAAILFGGIFLYPFLAGGGTPKFDGTVGNIVQYIEIYMILAIGLNIVVGYTGLLDLGYVAFIALGAVLTSFLLGLTHVVGGGIDWPIGITDPVVGEPVLALGGWGVFLILLIAGLVCALFGIIRGIPTLRVTGDYYAIVTLGIAEILYEVALWDDQSWLHELFGVDMTRLTGGAFGIKLGAAHKPNVFGTDMLFGSDVLYYVLFAAVVLAFVVSHHLNRSRVGRALAAIRLDETAAQACGVNVTRYKLSAFAVSGFLGGLGGGMYALWSDAMAVKSLDVWQSILVLSCIVLGGMGSLRGVALGSIILMGLGELLRESIGLFCQVGAVLLLVAGVLYLAHQYLATTGSDDDEDETTDAAGDKAGVRQRPHLFAIGRRFVIMIVIGVVLLFFSYNRSIAGVTLPPESRFLAYGVMLIVFMRFRPQGFMPPIRRGRKLTKDEIEELGRGDAPLYRFEGAGADAAEIAGSTGEDGGKGGSIPPTMQEGKGGES